MSEKYKKRLPDFTSELHVILQEVPESVESRLIDLAAKQRNLSLVLTETPGDITRFELKHRNGIHTTARVRGRILRWQGTETRFDCRGHTRSFALWLEAAWLTVVCVLALMFWTTTVAVWQFFFGFFVENDSAFFVMALGLALFTTWMISRLHFMSNITEKQEYADRSDLDDLMQLMMAFIHEVPQSDVTYEMDDLIKNDEKYHVETGLDGELQRVHTKK